MDATLQIVLPVFALIACGYALARSPLLSAEGVRGLNNFVFYVVVPGLLFRATSKGLPLETLSVDILYAFFGAVFLVYGLGALIGGSLFRLRWDESVLLAMGSTFGNTVMMGIPLILTAFGEAGAGPLTMIIAFHSTILISGTTILVEFSRGNRGTLLSTVWAAVIAVLRNPVILALLAGFGWFLTGWTLPAPASRFIDLLAGAAPACALGALGASLTGFRLAGDLKHAATSTVLKLAALPALVWLLATFVFELEPVSIAVAVILAALPTGANVFVLAQRYDIYTARAASGVLISTVLSVVTVGLVVIWFASA